MTPQEIKQFIKAYSELGGNVTDTAISFIKDDVNTHQIKLPELMKGLRFCHGKEQFMNWANIMKYVRGNDTVRDGGLWNATYTASNRR